MSIKDKSNTSNRDFSSNSGFYCDICPEKAIFMLKGTSGNLEPVIFFEKCTNCGLCKDIYLRDFVNNLACKEFIKESADKKKL